MHVKSLTLRGFLSYKDVTTVDFDPGFNIVVGPNGSGKSSLVTGLKFVMGDTSIDRSHCLHQGVSSKVLVGYVSLVLDNTDRRLPGFDIDEVTLRRDFGLKKDDFTLNGKKITKTELTGLLESAGFSKTNPYYFIHQHEVASLTRMTNTERLKLLKEVAGTRVYDERRLEASTSLDETRQRRRSIDATLSVITQRMEELREEQQELQEVLRLERQKRCIEGIIAARQLEEAEAEVSSLVSMKEKQLSKRSGLTNQLTSLTEQTNALDNQFHAASNDAKRLDLLLKDCRRQLAQTERELVRVNLEHEARSAETDKKKQQVKRKEKALRQLRGNRERLNDELKAVNAQLTELRNVLQVEESALLRARQELVGLQNRSSHGQRYVSLAERNRVLSKDIQTKEKELKGAKALLQSSQDQLASLETEHTTLNANPLAEKQHQLDADWKSVNERLAECRLSLSAIMSQRTALRDELEKGRQNHQRQLDVARQASRRLCQTIRPAQLSANQAAMRWAEMTSNQGVVYGSLLENIHVDPKYHIAVETAAGGQLFNLLVQNRHVAVDVVQFLKQERAGSTTVTPLRDIQVESLPGFDPNDSRVRPLVEVVDCHEEIRPAVRQVLGRFLLVEDRDVGVEYKSRGFDCITLDGDLVTRKGILCGGYRGNQIRLACQTEIHQANRMASDCQKQIQETETKASQLEDQLMHAQGTCRELEAQRATIQSHREEIIDQMRQTEKRNSRYQKRKEHLQLQIGGAESQIQVIKQDIQNLRREITSSTLGELTEVECARLEELGETVQFNEEKRNKLEKQISPLQAKVDDLSAELEGSVEPRINQLEDELAKIGLEGTMEDVEGDELIRKKKDLEKTLEMASSTVVSTESEWKHAQGVCNKLTTELSGVRSSEEKLQGQLEEIRLYLHTVDTQIEEAKLRRDKCCGKQISLSVPSEMANEFNELSSNDLMKELTKVIKTLKCYQHINRKALDQFTSFVDDHAVLLDQKDRLYKSEDSIVELMQSLDSQKDSTLLKAFENVNANFGKAFAMIVPGGQAKLILQKLSNEDIAHLQKDQRALAVSHSSASPQLSAVDIFTGMAVKVRFPGFKGYIPLESLSGGQKSVTALALVFALQRVDAAPFYVLDEIDANLDVQYRGAVAALIRSESQESQVIVVSHKPQTIHAADRFLKTSMVNQATVVAATTLENALLVSQRMAIESCESAAGQ